MNRSEDLLTLLDYYDAYVDGGFLIFLSYVVMILHSLLGWQGALKVIWRTWRAYMAFHGVRTCEHYSGVLQRREGFTLIPKDEDPFVSTNLTNAGNLSLNMRLHF